jgi:hypothetical protein
VGQWSCLMYVFCVSRTRGSSDKLQYRAKEAGLSGIHFCILPACNLIYSYTPSMNVVTHTSIKVSTCWRV